ncbi:hypothetical protein [Streptomyces olivaceiscleroticus]|uniref:Uncharacterized protein n=1 Tax=Streptomyces olivaceiscleroticus TaxID=68245 RepID=A0ABN0ZL71_9ACTN
MAVTGISEEGDCLSERFDGLLESVKLSQGAADGVECLSLTMAVAGLTQESDCLREGGEGPFEATISFHATPRNISAVPPPLRSPSSRQTALAVVVMVIQS